MQLDFAFLSDSAQVMGGKVYVLGGGFDRILTKQIPLAYPHMTLVIRLLLSPAEVGRSHRLEVFIMDDDGKKVTAVDGQLRAERPGTVEGWKPGAAIITLNFLNTKFEKLGSYAIDILVNGSSVKTLSLEIAERKEKPVGA